MSALNVVASANVSAASADKNVEPTVAEVVQTTAGISGVDGGYVVSDNEMDVRDREEALRTEEKALKVTAVKTYSDVKSAPSYFDKTVSWFVKTFSSGEDEKEKEQEAKTTAVGSGGSAAAKPGLVERSVETALDTVERRVKRRLKPIITVGLVVASAGAAYLLYQKFSKTEEKQSFKYELFSKRLKMVVGASSIPLFFTGGINEVVEFVRDGSHLVSTAAVIVAGLEFVGISDNIRNFATWAERKAESFWYGYEGMYGKTMAEFSAEYMYSDVKKYIVDKVEGINRVKTIFGSQIHAMTKDELKEYLQKHTIITIRTMDPNTSGIYVVQKAAVSEWKEAWHRVMGNAQAQHAIALSDLRFATYYVTSKYTEMDETYVEFEEVYDTRKSREVFYDFVYRTFGKEVGDVLCNKFTRTAIIVALIAWITYDYYNLRTKPELREARNKMRKEYKNQSLFSAAVDAADAELDVKENAVRQEYQAAQMEDQKRGRKPGDDIRKSGRRNDRASTKKSWKTGDSADFLPELEKMRMRVLEYDNERTRNGKPGMTYREAGQWEQLIKRGVPAAELSRAIDQGQTPDEFEREMRKESGDMSDTESAYGVNDRDRGDDDDEHSKVKRSGYESDRSDYGRDTGGYESDRSERGHHHRSRDHKTGYESQSKTSINKTWYPSKTACGNHQGMYNSFKQVDGRIRAGDRKKLVEAMCVCKTCTMGKTELCGREPKVVSICNVYDKRLGKEIAFSVYFPLVKGILKNEQKQKYAISPTPVKKKKKEASFADVEYVAALTAAPTPPVLKGMTTATVPQAKTVERADFKLKTFPMPSAEPTSISVKVTSAISDEKKDVKQSYHNEYPLLPDKIADAMVKIYLSLKAEPQESSDYEYALTGFAVGNYVYFPAHGYTDNGVNVNTLYIRREGTGFVKGGVATGDREYTVKDFYPVSRASVEMNIDLDVCRVGRVTQAICGGHKVQIPLTKSTLTPVVFKPGSVATAFWKGTSHITEKGVSPTEGFHSVYTFNGMSGVPILRRTSETFEGGWGVMGMHLSAPEDKGGEPKADSKYLPWKVMESAFVKSN